MRGNMVWKLTLCTVPAIFTALLSPVESTEICCCGATRISTWSPSISAPFWKYWASESRGDIGNWWQTIQSVEKDGSSRPAETTAPVVASFFGGLSRMVATQTWIEFDGLS